MTKWLTIAAAVCAAGLLALAVDPALDLDVAALFYVPPAHFIGNTPVGMVARYMAWTAPFALLAALILASLLAWTGAWPRRAALAPRGLACVVLCFALSPGLLVYATFKPLAHRPRPHSIAQFGGPDRFRPFTRFDGACTRSCSFPSGETAGAVWTLAPASLVPPPWRAAALAAAVVFGAGTGLLRIAFGGHFLSDVLAAALFTLVALIAARFVLPRPSDP